jgi:hypothetical protein
VCECGVVDAVCSVKVQYRYSVEVWVWCGECVLWWGRCGVVDTVWWVWMWGGVMDVVVGVCSGMGVGV